LVVDESKPTNQWSICLKGSLSISTQTVYIDCVGKKKFLFGEKNMSKRTDVYAIQNDLASAIGRRNEAINTILDLTAELREAKRIATYLEKTPSQRFQEARDAGKVDVFAELAKT
jgi:hypothetical protein